MSTHTLGTRLRELRKRTPKLTQAEVAEAVGIARAFLSQMESDGAKPGRETLGALAEYFGVSRDYLETGSPPIGSQNSAKSYEQAQQIQLIRLWNDLNDRQRRAILEIIEAFRQVPASHETNTLNNIIPNINRT